ncbi:MAG: hypothetical protein LAQ30_14425 [Acidobacteriia bacterium]|nr:hypothetical protein [Terriglobia bacterium]
MAEIDLQGSLAAIPQPHRVALEARLRQLNSARLENRLDKTACIREAFNEIARSFHENGERLTEEALASRIPDIICNWAIASGWFTIEEAESASFYWGLASFNYRNPPPIPPPGARLGSHLVQDAFRNWFMWQIRGRIENWRAEELTRGVESGLPKPNQTGATEPGGGGPTRTEGGPVVRRGRPEKIPKASKQKALEVKNDGGTNRDAARALYNTSYPTHQQVKNVSSMLRNYKRTLSEHKNHKG